MQSEPDGTPAVRRGCRWAGPHDAPGLVLGRKPHVSASAAAALACLSGPLLGLPRLGPGPSWPLPPATGLGVRNPVRPVPLASHTAAPASLLAAHCPARRPPPTKERRKPARPSPPARFAAAELRRVLRPAEAESALAAEHRPAYCLQVRQPCAVLGARARRGRPDSASLVLMGNPPRPRSRGLRCGFGMAGLAGIQRLPVPLEPC